MEKSTPNQRNCRIPMAVFNPDMIRAFNVNRLSVFMA